MFQVIEYETEGNITLFQLPDSSISALQHCIGVLSKYWQRCSCSVIRELKSLNLSILLSCPPNLALTYMTVHEDEVLEFDRHLLFDIPQ